MLLLIMSLILQVVAFVVDQDFSVVDVQMHSVAVVAHEVETNDDVFFQPIDYCCCDWEVVVFDVHVEFDAAIDLHQVAICCSNKLLGVVWEVHTKRVFHERSADHCTLGTGVDESFDRFCRDFALQLERFRSRKGEEDFFLLC